MTDPKAPLLTDIGSPLKVTSSLENIILLVMAVAIVIVLILFCTTPISRKIMVQGQLSSNSFEQAIHASQQGLVKRVLVRKGDQVKKGDPLLELTIESATDTSTVSVLAESDGIITQVIAETNHLVRQNQPLFLIGQLQQNWKLELYLPSNAIGSVTVGDAMDIRFDAFPSRIYGSQFAVVRNISVIPVSANEINHLMLNPAEAYYRVDVELPKGCDMPKNSCDKWRLGMRLNSIVVIEKTVFIDRLLKPITAR
jgi:hypothetical protein